MLFISLINIFERLVLPWGSTQKILSLFPKSDNCDGKFDKLKCISKPESILYTAFFKLFFVDIFSGYSTFGKKFEFYINDGIYPLPIEKLLSIEAKFLRFIFYSFIFSNILF